MTNSQLELLISQLNNNQNKENIILRPLSGQVDFAKVWIEIKKPIQNKSFINGPLNFYFIKKDDGVYVSVLRDMIDDLHCFTLPDHRRQGHLFKAMKDVILFHLFQDRDEQRITIDEDKIGIENYKASKRVAEKLGFKSLNNGLDTVFTLNFRKYRTIPLIMGMNAGISKERMIELANQFEFMSSTLGKIGIEFEMKLGTSKYTKELKELSEQINKHTWRIEDEWCKWENQ